MNEIPAYIQLLQQRQIFLGENESEFCARLAIDRKTWLTLQRGGEPSVRTLRSILRVFPDLAHAVLQFLMPENASRVAKLVREPSKRRAAS